MKIYTQPLFKRTAKATDLIITQGGFVTTDDTWHQQPLYSIDSRLYLVTDGSGMLVSDRESMKLEPNYVYLAPCSCKCGFFGTNSVTKLYFHVKLLTEPDNTDLLSRLTHFLRLPITQEEIEALKELYLSTDPLDHVLLKSALFGIVAKFLESEKQNLSEYRGHSPAVLNAIGYINTHLSARLTVGEVANAVFLAQSKLSARFREEVGQSVAAYIDDLLMSEARNRLGYTDDSIAKISERLGYCDQFYFSRAFRRHFGTSPTQYRKSKK